MSTCPPSNRYIFVRDPILPTPLTNPFVCVRLGGSALDDLGLTEGRGGGGATQEAALLAEVLDVLMEHALAAVGRADEGHDTILALYKTQKKIFEYIREQNKSRGSERKS